MDDVCRSFVDVKRSHVYECLAYYEDHRAEIDDLVAGGVVVSCNRNDVLALHPEGEHPDIVILVRRRTRQAEIAAMQKLVNGAGDQGLSNNTKFA